MVKIELDYEEALEIFSRCLSSPLEDTTVSMQAMRKLASAIEGTELQQERRAA